MGMEVFDVSVPSLNALGLCIFYIAGGTGIALL